MKFFKLLPIFVVLSSGFLQAQQFSTKKLDGLLNILFEKNKGMGSLAVTDHGKVVYQKAVGYSDITDNTKISSTVETKYRIGSITKMFTGVLIFQLIDENKLSLNSTIDKYYPSLPNASSITIEHLLRHQSGLHNFTDDSSYASYYTKPKTQEELIQLISGIPADFMPGSNVRYSNSNFIILGFLAEKITGTSYPELIKKRITKPINLKNTVVGKGINSKNNEAHSFAFFNGWNKLPETDMSIPAGAGSIISTATDLTYFIDALFDGKLVSKTALQQMQLIREGLGMAMFSFPFYERKAFGHNGSIDGFGSTLGHFSTDSISVAWISNGQVYPQNDLLIGILNIIFNRPYSIPNFDPITQLTEEIRLDNYTGLFTSKQIPLKINIRIEDGKLMAQASGQSAFELKVTGKDQFSFDPAGIIIRYEANKNMFTLMQGGRNYLFEKEN